MSLRVRDPGLCSLLVDAGRPRTRHLGLPLGGAADRFAYALGNALVGNDAGALALEVTLFGPTLEAVAPVACVVFGPAFESAVNVTPVRANTTFTLAPGDVLRVGGTRTGCRGYVCVAGGFDAPALLGSRSALEPVRAGDVLACRPSRCEPRSPAEEVFPSDTSVLRVLDGPQRDWFTGDSFFTSEYEVSPASNRMGVRLKGPPLARRAGELVSEAVAPGAVQVTNDGLPVVLGADGQTIGGYPKVAHVVRADLDALAQLRPGDRVRFVRVTPTEAAGAARERAARLGGWLARCRTAERPPEFV
ncbi:Allophanate hydrolase subunit 2 OS=Geobacillus thermodenitrificans (strain NG80-2) GN=GTNG_1352 PE=4 SV=1: AHS2 [Gemmataceae bacterium]|nr:Allophanate hydrolase subunit 2 OS=Geobacillus thermodenitrificans (strain NG80-2) GN=GTNG_1352 PE=4 SV=1: AHS2 [Gemmataceae bacterium]VTU00367.1 Allophanate hydrolase subunit 2 OS=Geobacillus thermodenitrificans (strain NG80-2) GN=GTNG_1352 PE=4 SV=1: AHS2 [Gemmataceae bacterium]